MSGQYELKPWTTDFNPISFNCSVISVDWQFWYILSITLSQVKWVPVWFNEFNMVELADEKKTDFFVISFYEDIICRSQVTPLPIHRINEAVFNMESFLLDNMRRERKVETWKSHNTINVDRFQSSGISYWSKIGAANSVFSGCQSPFYVWQFPSNYQFILICDTSYYPSQ